MTASQQPLLTKYQNSDYSEMSLQITAGNRPCVICQRPITKGSKYLFALTRISKTTTRRHVCRTCCLIRPDSELSDAWNTLLRRGDG